MLLNLCSGLWYGWRSVSTFLSMDAWLHPIYFETISVFWTLLYLTLCISTLWLFQSTILVYCLRLILIKVQVSNDTVKKKKKKKKKNTSEVGGGGMGSMALEKLAVLQLWVKLNWDCKARALCNLSANTINQTTDVAENLTCTVEL